MKKVFRRAHEHKGSAFVEIYQNCNVFNDGAFEGITAKESRADMLIELKHGEPIRFGNDNEEGIVLNEFGECEIVTVADVGEDALLVHDETAPIRRWRSRCRGCRRRPPCPRRSACSASVTRPTYENEVQRQLVAAVERQGPGDLAALIGTGATWEVN